MTASERQTKFRERLRNKSYNTDGIFYWSDSDEPVPPRVLKAAGWDVTQPQIDAYLEAFPDDDLEKPEVSKPESPFKVVRGEGSLYKQKEDALLRKARTLNPKRQS